jgi:hypothetical protein
MKYIRDTYGVPIKRGARVEYSGGEKIVFGTVKSAGLGYMKILIDGEKKSKIFHPTWKIRYCV